MIRFYGINTIQERKTMKNKDFFESIKCAWEGLKYAFQTEKNFKYYGWIASFFAVLNLMLQVPLWYHFLFLGFACGVISAEFVNTAIEHLTNYVECDVRPEIKLIKDIAAAAVLFWGIGFFVYEFVLLGVTLSSY